MAKFLIPGSTSLVQKATVLGVSWLSLQWRDNERDGDSNHRRPDCLLKCLFRRRSKKTTKLCVIGTCEGNSPATGESPPPPPTHTHTHTHKKKKKGPETRKIFPFDDVIMIMRNISGEKDKIRNSRWNVYEISTTRIIWITRLLSISCKVYHKTSKLQKDNASDDVMQRQFLEEFRCARWTKWSNIHDGQYHRHSCWRSLEEMAFYK